MYTTAQIKVTHPASRKTVRGLETKRCVKIETPNPNVSGVWHKWEDVVERNFDRLTGHYGVDMRELSKEYQYIK